MAEKSANRPRQLGSRTPFCREASLQKVKHSADFFIQRIQKIVVVFVKKMQVSGLFAFRCFFERSDILFRKPQHGLPLTKTRNRR